MPYFALWGRTLKADTPEFSTTVIFVSTAKGNWGLCIRKCLACLYEHLGTGLDSFLNRKVTCTGNKWWRETLRRDREGRFCTLWYWMWVPGCRTESRNCHSVQAYTFRTRKISLWKGRLHTTFRLSIFTVSALYGKSRSSTHSSDLYTNTHKKKKKAQYNSSGIHLFMSYTVFTMLAHLQFKLQVASQADYVMNYTHSFVNSPK
jgi:hypothetical protein